MLQKFLPALALAFCAAHLCIWLDTPLPWMIGPIFATAAACMLGVPLRAPVQAREAGQWAIGTTLGLYFTPAVLAVLGAYSGWIVLAVAFALASGWLGGVALQRLAYEQVQAAPRAEAMPRRGKLKTKHKHADAAPAR